MPVDLNNFVSGARSIAGTAANTLGTVVNSVNTLKTQGFGAVWSAMKVVIPRFITKITVDNVENLNSLLLLIQPYTNSVSLLNELPDKQNINILYIQVVSIMIILLIIIFFGIHK
jgi:hypothetical protein